MPVDESSSSAAMFQLRATAATRRQYGRSGQVGALGAAQGDLQVSAGHGGVERIHVLIGQQRNRGKDVVA